MTRRQIALAFLLAAAALPAGAQMLKPGLWEVRNKMQGGSGQMQDSMSQMQKQIASMPPEQRKMIEEQMAKSGVKMGAAGPAGGMSVKICLTPEMVQKNQIPAQNGDCKTTEQNRTGNTMRMAFACTSPPSTGQAQISFYTPEWYAMKMEISTQVEGKPERINMEGDGRWLANDCGSVKPIAQQAPKK